MAEERGRWAYENIWVVSREGDGWGEPYLLDGPINSDSTGSFLGSGIRKLPFDIVAPRSDGPDRPACASVAGASAR